VLVTTGGGGDGAPLITAYLEGLSTLARGIQLRTTVIFGPQIDEGARATILRRFRSLPDVDFCDFEPDLATHYEKADVIVAMAGYNTVCELLSCRRPAVLVPRAHPVGEQLLRARLFAARGYFDCIEPQDLGPDVLIARVLEAADRIVDAARRHPGKLTTVFQFRYLPEVRRTRWLSERGHVGRLLSGRFSRYARFETPGKPAKAGKTAKAGKERADWWGRWGIAGGGVVMTQLIHDLDLMCHFFGKPTEVTAVIDTLKEQIESEDTCAATIRFEGGALACCYGTMTAQRTASALDVVGELASVSLPWAFECPDRKRRGEPLREALKLYPPSARSGTVAALGAWLQRAGVRGTPTATAHTPTWQMCSTRSRTHARCRSGRRRRALRSNSAPPFTCLLSHNARSMCRLTAGIRTTPGCRRWTTTVASPGGGRLAPRPGRTCRCVESVDDS
jgi:hypothetical protein